MMVLWLNDTLSKVVFANDNVAVLVRENTSPIDLGTRVMYEMSPEWWGYVGKVVATFSHNFKQELFVQYDTSIAGFSNQTDAYDYFDKIL